MGEQDAVGELRKNWSANYINQESYD